MLNPRSEKELRSICMYFKEALDLRPPYCLIRYMLAFVIVCANKQCHISYIGDGVFEVKL